MVEVEDVLVQVSPGWLDLPHWMDVQQRASMLDERAGGWVAT